MTLIRIAFPLLGVCHKDPTSKPLEILYWTRLDWAGWPWIFYMKLYSLLCVALLLGIAQGEGKTSRVMTEIEYVYDGPDIVYTIK